MQQFISYNLCCCHQKLSGTWNDTDRNIKERHFILVIGPDIPGNNNIEWVLRINPQFHPTHWGFELQVELIVPLPPLRGRSAPEHSAGVEAAERFMFQQEGYDLRHHLHITHTHTHIPLSMHTHTPDTWHLCLFSLLPLFIFSSGPTRHPSPSCRRTSLIDNKTAEEDKERTEAKEERDERETICPGLMKAAGWWK